jgi:hypothetical protein
VEFRASQVIQESVGSVELAVSAVFLASAEFQDLAVILVSVDLVVYLVSLVYLDSAGIVESVDSLGSLA